MTVKCEAEAMRLLSSFEFRKAESIFSLVCKLVLKLRMLYVLLVLLLVVEAIVGGVLGWQF